MAVGGIPLNIVLRYLQSPTMEKDIRDIGNKAGLELKRVFGDIFNVALPALSATGLSQLAIKVSKEIHNINVASKDLGVSAKELDAWMGTVGMVGVKGDTFIGMMKGLRRSIVEISRGGRGGLWEEMIRGWMPMGGIDRLRKEGPLVYLEEIAKHIDKLKAKGVAEADIMLALEKIGITDQNLKNLLIQGSTNLAKLREEGQKLLLIEAKDLEMAERMFKGYNTLQKYWNYSLRQTFRDIVPVVNGATEAINNFISANPWVQNAVGHTITGLGVAGTLVGGLATARMGWRALKKIGGFAFGVGGGQGGTTGTTGGIIDAVTGGGGGISTVKRMNVNAGVVKVMGPVQGGAGGVGGGLGLASLGHIGLILAIFATAIYSAKDKLDMIGLDGKGLKDWFKNSDSGQALAEKLIEATEGVSKETREGIIATLGDSAKQKLAESKKDDGVLGDDDYANAFNINETVIINGVGMDAKGASDFVDKNRENYSKRLGKQKLGINGSTGNVH